MRFLWSVLSGQPFRAEQHRATKEPGKARRQGEWCVAGQKNKEACVRGTQRTRGQEVRRSVQARSRESFSTLAFI